MVEQESQFKDPTGLTKWTKLFLNAQIVIVIIAIISNIMEYQFLFNLQNGVYTSQESVLTDMVANTTRQGTVTIIRFIIYIISGILILKWIYRANYNARQIGASGMLFTPGWSIGWYFIPIACLWKPYQAMKEIWKASSNPQNWENVPVPSLLPWWWFFWIVSGVFAKTLNLLYIIPETEEVHDFIVANISNQLCDLIEIPLYLILIAIINGIYSMQMYHVQSKQSI